MANVCGTGTWTGPKPGDPDNNSVLSAVPAFGGIDVSWTYPATNPYAVAYVLLYRGVTPDFALALSLGEKAGNSYYDKLDTGTTYYYWIQIVSVNGTVGTLIGPASATAKPLIADLIQQLTGQIDKGLLAQALKTEIDRITLNHTDILAEIQNRLAGDNGLSVTLSQVQGDVDGAIAAIQSEQGTRLNGDNALAAQIDLVAAANQSNAALIETERLTRVDADAALGLRIDSVNAANQDNASAVQEVTQARIGYAVLVSNTSIPYDGDGVTEVYPEVTYPAVTFPDYALNRKRIIDKTGVTNWNATPAGVAKPLQWLVGLPLATAVKQVEVTGPDGQVASLQTSMVAQKDLNNQVKVLYTAKMNVNGLIGGWGMLNDGQTVQAGFDVDSFWVGRTGANLRKPFIISGNETFIDQAVINALTFTKLRDESGSVVVENGQIKTNFLDTRGLQIKDIFGNVIFSAGTALDWSRIGGLNRPADGATRNVVFRQNTAPVAGMTVNDIWIKTDTNETYSYSGADWIKVGDVTANNTAASIVGQGALATRNMVAIGESSVQIYNGQTGQYQIMGVADFINKLAKVGSGTIGNFFENAAIGSAYIGNAAIGSAHIVDLSVDSFKIAGQAVTTDKMALGAVSAAVTSRTMGAGTSVGINIPINAQSAVIIAAGGDSYIAPSGADIPASYSPCPYSVSITGSPIMSNVYNSQSYVYQAPPAGYYTVSLDRQLAAGASSFSSDCSLLVMVFKR